MQVYNYFVTHCMRAMFNFSLQGLWESEKLNSFMKRELYGWYACDEDVFKLG